MVMTSDRITIMLDKDISKRIRVRQADLLKKSNKSVSFSQVVNDCLKVCISKKLC